MKPNSDQKNFSLKRFRLGIFAVLVLLLLSIFLAAQRPANPSNTTSADGGTTCASSTAVGHAQVQAAFSQISLPHTHSDLMSPAIDANGNIWFGEMGTNQLGEYSPTTQQVREWTPPNGEYGIMGIAADLHGQIWFAEESANYIARFTPSTCAFVLTPLPARAGQNAAPVGLALTTQGQPWFTLFGNSQIGTIDATGTLHLYPLAYADKQHQPLPYGITVGQDGGIWFTELQGGAIGRLDPATGAVRTFALANPQAQSNAITTAPDGRIWFTEMSGTIGVIDPRTDTLREFATPPQFGNTAQLYDILVDPAGTVWITSSGANALLSYQPSTGSWQRHIIPSPEVAPYGLAMAHDALWFTEAADAANSLGRFQFPSPSAG